MKKILGIISVVGVLGATGFLVFCLISNSGIISPRIKPAPACMPIWEFAKFEPGFAGFAKYDSPDFAKYEGADQEQPNPPPDSLPFNCAPFSEMDISLVFLSIREDIMVLPVYLKTEGDMIPGLVPSDDTQPVEYHAMLGDKKSNICELQGFDDRLYCMFPITPDMPGSVVDYFLYIKDCSDPVVTQLDVFIPELTSKENNKPQCNRDMSPEECNAAGGKMSEGTATAPVCVCP